jgi:hypothetical protein
MSDATIRTRCACGWLAEGPPDEVVPATIEHGLRLHNMRATADQVLAMAEGVGGTTAQPETDRPAEAERR